MRKSQNRSEAKGVPSLLVAPPSPSKKRDPTPNGPKDLKKSPKEQEDQYFYADGAFTSISRSHTVRNPRDEPQDEAVEGDSCKDGETSTQGLYAKQLLRRFDYLRRGLHVGNTPIASMPIPVPETHKAWRELLTSSPPTIPTPALLLSFPQSTVLHALSALSSLTTTRCMVQQPPKTLRALCAWTWSLLARCRDVGDMDSEDVGIVRELGKVASAELRRLKAGITDGGDEDNPADMEEDFEEDEMMEDEEKIEQDEEETFDDATAEGEGEGKVEGEVVEDEDEDEDSEIFNAKARILSRLSVSPPTSQEKEHPPIDTLDRNPAAKSERGRSPSRNKTGTRRRNTSSPLSSSPQAPSISFLKNPSDVATTMTTAAAAAGVVTVPSNLNPPPPHQPKANTSRDQESADSETQKTTVSALLTTILIIVGHRYGQKDLLENMAALE